jgi:NADPH:quinone reductase-like Zn-dependent oxidoreductase
MNPILGLVTRAFGRRKARMPIPRPLDQRGVERLRDMLASGAFRPVIDRRYPLDQIVEAYRYVESGNKIGNVVIEVVPSSNQVGS